MPKISEEHRQGRRDQILAAVWQCFLRKGVNGTSMDDILCESGLSSGAVYRYYKGKDEIILAAISTYMAQLGSLLAPLLSAENPPPPSEFMYEVLSALDKHTHRVGLDLNAVILMGWSEAQTNPDVRAIIQAFQARSREALIHIVRKWQAKQYLAAESNPEEVGKALFSFFLGTIAQQALLGDADPASLSRGICGIMTGTER